MREVNLASSHMRAWAFFSIQAQIEEILLNPFVARLVDVDLRLPSCVA